MQAPADFEEDAADPAEQPRALEPQVLAIADAPLRVPEHPAEDGAPQRVRGQRVAHALLRFTAQAIGR